MYAQIKMCLSVITLFLFLFCLFSCFVSWDLGPHTKQYEIDLHCYYDFLYFFDLSFFTFDNLIIAQNSLSILFLF